jgi:dTDP-4-dehydrorhamnose 3,5-epimerase
LRRIETAIPDVLLFATGRNEDERGFLAEIYNRSALAALGVGTTFVQDNLSHSPRAFTMRGLHFQLPPYEQAKLVRVLRGRAVTAAVDLRGGSPTYGGHVLVELSAANWRQLLVPRGFAHGVLTLEPETTIFYKLDAHHAGGHARGVAWDDPDLAIPWPVARERVIVSAKDRAQPAFRELGPIFDDRPAGP